MLTALICPIGFTSFTGDKRSTPTPFPLTLAFDEAELRTEFDGRPTDEQLKSLYTELSAAVQANSDKEIERLREKGELFDGTETQLQHMEMFLFDGNTPPLKELFMSTYGGPLSIAPVMHLRFDDTVVFEV